MNISSKDLFLLIKSLTGAEKRYFRKFSTIFYKGGENISVLLFDAINKQKRYDEAAIIRQLPGKVTQKRLPKEKNYLSQLILKSLRNCHANKSADMQIKNLLQDIEILYDKALYHHCEKLLIKAKKIASAYQKDPLMLKIIKWEKRVYFSEETLLDLKKTLLEEKNILSQINKEHEYHYFLLNLSDIIKTMGSNRSRENIQMLKELVKLPLLKSDYPEHSFRAKNLYYKSYAILYRETGNLRKSLRFCKKWVELNESQPEQISENPVFYIDALDNLLHCSGNPENEDNYLTTLKKLKSIPEKFPKTRTRSIEAAISIRYYYHLLSLHNRTGDFANSITMVPEIKSWLKYSGTKTNKYYCFSLYLFITIAYLALKNHTKALVWIKKILEGDCVKEGNNVYAISHVLNLIIHYDLYQYKSDSEDLDRIETLFRSAYRSMKKGKHSYAFESIILNFLKTQYFTKSSAKKLKTIKELQKQFIELMKDPYEKKILDYFDFIRWMDSQIKINTQTMNSI